MAITGTSSTITISAASSPAATSSAVPNVRRQAVTNSLTALVYSSGTTLASDPAGDLRAIQNVKFTKFYGLGGIYGDASFFVPRDVNTPWSFSGNYRVVIRNGQKIVYEGYIASHSWTVSDNEQGITVNCVGAWAWLLENQVKDKRWCDMRMDSSAWKWRNNSVEKATDDRNSRIRVTPKGVAWLNGDIYSIEYMMPTNETVKRVICTYNLQEGAQAWSLGLADYTGGYFIWQVTSSGSGSRDDTLATPRQAVSLDFRALANQTPTEDGTYYGQFSNVHVHSETGNINLREIAVDVAGMVSALSSDTSQISTSLTFALEPFITNGYESLASILCRAARFGDGSFNQIAVGVKGSDLASDGKPILFAETWPSLSDYDYAVRFDEENLIPPISIVKDYAGVRNWITVKYRDELGVERYITPVDDANLGDTTSATAYGYRHAVLDAGKATSSTATNYGRRYLAAFKDPKFYVSGPITVQTYIRGKYGNLIPASEIEPGKRIKLQNFLSDEAGVPGAGLTFVITQVDYDDDTQTAKIATGMQDMLSVYLAQQELELIP